MKPALTERCRLPPECVCGSEQGRLSGADKAWIGFGTDTTAPPGGQEMGQFDIFLYSDSLQTGYSVSYYMNIVGSNLTYPIRDRRWNRLLMQLPFVFLNSGPVD